MKKLSVVPNTNETIFGFIYLAVQLTVLQPILVVIGMLIGVPISEAVLNFLFFAINFICVTILLHRYLITSGKVALENVFGTLRGAFLGFAVYWLLNIFISLLIQKISPDFFNVNDSSIAELTKENYTLMAIGTVLLVPITEEALYRGLIFGRLYNFNRILAYAVSTVFFCALHVVGYIGLYSPLQLLLCLIQYVPAGLCLGWAYAKTGTIWAPILIHITINQIAISTMR